MGQEFPSKWQESTWALVRVLKLEDPTYAERYLVDDGTGVASRKWQESQREKSLTWQTQLTAGFLG